MHKSTSSELCITLPHAWLTQVSTMCNSLSVPWWLIFWQLIWRVVSDPTIPGLALMAWRYFRMTSDISDTIILCKGSTKSVNEYLHFSNRCNKYNWKRETYRGRNVQNEWISISKAAGKMHMPRYNCKRREITAPGCRYAFLPYE